MTSPDLGGLMGAWLAVVIVATFVQIATGRLTAFLSGNIAADLRSSVYRAIEHLQVSYFDKKQVGAITSRVTQDTDRVWGFLVDGLPYLVSNALLLVGVGALLFLTNVKLALAVLAPMPLVLILSGVFWKPISQKYFRVGQKWARFHMHLNESLTGIRVVKAFAKEDHEYDRFTQRNQELRDAGIEADVKWFTIFSAMILFTSMGALINWTYGGYMVYRGELSLGNFVRMNAFIGMIYMPLQWFGQLNQWFSRAMAGAERIFEIIDAEKEQYAKENGKPHAIEGEVQFDNVRFGYDKSNPILKGLELYGQTGRDDWAGRQIGRGQVHHHQSTMPLLRAGRGQHQDRRHRLPRHRPSGYAPSDRHRVAGTVSLQWHGSREHLVRQAGRLF